MYNCDSLLLLLEETFFGEEIIVPQSSSVRSPVYSDNGEDPMQIPYFYVSEGHIRRKKGITTTWLKQRPLSSSEWLTIINNVLPYKKWLYRHSYCPNKIWDY